MTTAVFVIFWVKNSDIDVIWPDQSITILPNYSINNAPSWISLFFFIKRMIFDHCEGNTNRHAPITIIYCFIDAQATKEFFLWNESNKLIGIQWEIRRHCRKLRELKFILNWFSLFASFIHLVQKVLRHTYSK